MRVSNGRLVDIPAWCMTKEGKLVKYDIGETIEDKGGIDFLGDMTSNIYYNKIDYLFLTQSKWEEIGHIKSPKAILYDDGLVAYHTGSNNWEIDTLCGAVSTVRVSEVAIAGIVYKLVEDDWVKRVISKYRVLYKR